MVYAVILAGGSGTRMGTDIPKQFLEICSRPVIVRSIDAFVSSGLTDRIILCVPAIYTEYTEELVHKYTSADVTVICGGANRNGSLMNALEYIKNTDGLTDDSIVLTHDAVRPFISEKIIADNIEAARAYGGCNTVISCVDTMLVSEDGKFISSVPPRKNLYHAQTPQSFNAKLLYEVYRGMTEDEAENMTDACSVFLKYGHRVALVKGSTDNIKITYKSDIERAEQIIKSAEENNK